jgi:histidinol-phosphate aminotransferase
MSEEPRAKALAQRWIRPQVQAMASYHVPDAAGFVKLDAMENPYGLPAAVQTELASALSAVALNRYPQPAYASLKHRLRDAFGVPEASQIMVGNGSDELISLVIQATAPGAVVSAWPSFVMYDISARLAGSPFIGVDLKADTFALDRQAMLEAIDRHQPAVVFLAFPNNPTGNAFAEDDVLAVLHAAPGLVIIDEAYQPFAANTWMHRLPDHPNMLVMRTVSKLGLAGVRLGYMAADPALIEQIEKLRPPYNVNVLTDAAVQVVLRHKSVLDQQAAQLRADRQRLAQGLGALPGVQVFDSQANFVLARLPDAPRAFDALKSRGILVKDVSRAHRLLAHCLRFTVGTPAENQAVLAALRQFLSESTS